MGTQGHRGMGTGLDGGHGDVGRWRHEDIDRWGNGDMGTQGHRETGRQGDMGTQGVLGHRDTGNTGDEAFVCEDTQDTGPGMWQHMGHHGIGPGVWGHLGQWGLSPQAQGHVGSHVTWRTQSPWLGRTLPWGHGCSAEQCHSVGGTWNQRGLPSPVCPPVPLSPSHLPPIPLGKWFWGHPAPTWLAGGGQQSGTMQDGPIYRVTWSFQTEVTIPGDVWSQQG